MSDCGGVEARREEDKQPQVFFLFQYLEIYLQELIFPTHVHTHTHSSPMLQCSPSQPGWQMQVPSWHWPCSSQRGWHALWSHAAPVQPSSHWHWPSEQAPWLPHGTGHSSAMQGRKRSEERHNEWVGGETLRICFKRKEAKMVSYRI